MTPTEEGMDGAERVLQPLKAPLPMESSEEGRLTDLKPWQPAKASFPMLVTEVGRDTAVREEHWAKE